MILENYLALLSWQGQKITGSDFEHLKESAYSSPEDIKNIVSVPRTKEFMIYNPFWWKQAEEDYKKCRKKGYHLTFLGQKDYPEFFTILETPPVLTYIGEPPYPQPLFPLAIVGSRDSHEITLNWMDFYLPKIIQEKPLCIVSGGARGVDQKSHRLAIRLKKPTICFVPSGLDELYPASLFPLKPKILDYGGTFVSCFPPQERMQKSFFHVRNTLMACYSKLILVLQAQIRSGSMITAKKGLDHGVPVATLPGSVLSANFSGNLQLLYDGAFLLRDGVDLDLLIENLRWSTGSMGNILQTTNWPSLNHQRD